MFGQPFVLRRKRKGSQQGIKQECIAFILEGERGVKGGWGREASHMHGRACVLPCERSTYCPGNLSKWLP